MIPGKYVSPATGEYLDRWADLCGLTRKIGETDDTLRERVMARLKNPRNRVRRNNGNDN